MENIPQTNGITYNLGPDLESDEEKFMGQFHSITPQSCPYCNNCHPHVVVEFFFDFCGEPFTWNWLICQSTGVGSTPSICAMRMVHSSNVRCRQTVLSRQPDCSPRLQATLAAQVEINSLKALVLFDSGSTMDSITPEFAFATRAKLIKLEEQVVLQLGCVGSWSKISYGTKVPVNLCSIQDQIYLDLVNIDWCDCVIGTPFMYMYGVCLDFGKCTIWMNGQEINTLSFNENNNTSIRRNLVGVKDLDPTQGDSSHSN
jgi:hypothetical protein